METQILYGKPVADTIRAKLKNKVEKLAKKRIVPGLAAVLVGDDPASKVYVASKEKVFAKLNCHTRTFKLPEDIEEDILLEMIDELNHNPKYHGILLQLPLPEGFDSTKILHSISPKKDVDGFHPMNLGLLLEGNPNFISCTPFGIIEMIRHYKIGVNGKNVVIIGRSNIVGKPMFALLAQKFRPGNATVTICHTGTRDLASHTRNADIIIAASGAPNLLKGDMVKEGVVIFDVGINRVNANNEKGYKIVGDVACDEMLGKAAAITPVPKGVGPMTITMLLANTIQSAENFVRDKN